VLDLLGLILARNEVVDLAHEGGEPIGAEIGQEGAADVKAAGDARHGGEALVSRGRRDRVAVSHPHADERDPGSAAQLGNHGRGATVD
jgi:hypothetical protein